jgi:peptide chain release factor subunit 1
MESSDQVERIEQFKMKRLIKKLENARGAGTSMISIILRPKNHIADITR